MLVAALRAFLRFCFLEGLVEVDLSGFVNSTWPHRDRLIWPHQWDTFAKSLVPDGHFGWSPRKLNSQ